jgi:hypothetical protein
LQAPGHIRSGGGAVEELDTEASDIYRQFYRLTQAYIQSEFDLYSDSDTSFTSSTLLYRGMYPEEYASLIGKLIEHPYESAYLLEENVASSYTLSREIAENWDEGIVVTWPLIGEAVAFACDLLRQPPQRVDPEGEVHVLTGALCLDSSRVLVNLRTTQQAKDLIRPMSSPAFLSEPEHRDILQLLVVLENQAVTAETFQANQRLWRWYDYCDQNSVFDKKRLTLAHELVYAIVGAREED